MLGEIYIYIIISTWIYCRLIFVPSASDLFFEYDGAHDGGYDHAERIEGRDEHRASLPRHDTLHVVCHAGAHYTLYSVRVHHIHACIYMGVKIIDDQVLLD